MPFWGNTKDTQAAPVDASTRRQPLQTTRNPDVSRDYISTMKGWMHDRKDKMSANAVRVTIRYVPDKAILKMEAFDHYIDSLNEKDWPNLETIANSILDDLWELLSPRWIQVDLGCDDTSRGVEGYGVHLEEKKEDWDNARLLGRLKHF